MAGPLGSFFARLRPRAWPHVRHHRNAGTPLESGTVPPRYRVTDSQVERQPLHGSPCGKAGARIEARSPDIAPRVLVRIQKLSLGIPLQGTAGSHFAGKAKDEARSGRVLRPDMRDFAAFILTVPGMKAFLWVHPA